MVLGVQIIGILFGLFMLYMTFLHLKRNEYGFKTYFFWLFLWVGFLLVAIFPWVLDRFIKPLSIVRTFDLLVILGMMFLVGISFYNYTVVAQTQKRVEKIIRKLALKGDSAVPEKPQNEGRTARQKIAQKRQSRPKETGNEPPAASAMQK